MESGAKGCEIIVSGKLRGQRAKSMKFLDGLMIHSGDPMNDFVDQAVRHVLLRQGKSIFTIILLSSFYHHLHATTPTFMWCWEFSWTDALQTYNYVGHMFLHTFTVENVIVPQSALCLPRIKCLVNAQCIKTWSLGTSIVTACMLYFWKNAWVLHDWGSVCKPFQACTF